MQIKNKQLKNALGSLILRNTFFSALLLQQNIVEVKDDPSCETMDVDGETLRYNPEYINSLTFDETKGALAHAAMHLALAHPNRMGNRDPEIWDQAADYTVNGELMKKGFKMPKGALQDAKYDDKSCEDIYRILRMQPPQGGKGNKNGKGGGQGQPGQGQPGQGQGEGNGGGNKKNAGACQMRKAAQTDAQAKAAIMKAVSTSRQCGDKSMDFDRLVKELQPKIDWKEIINRFFSEIYQGDYSFRKPNRRFTMSNVIMPTLESRTMGKVILACDTSGSISEAEVSAMVSEILSCLSTYSEMGVETELTVIYADAEVKRVEVLTSGDVPKPAGGGGTRFIPTFKYIEEHNIVADCIIYLSDGYTSDFWEKEPTIPVLWGLICDNPSFSPPSGEVFRFDMNA